MRKHIKLAICTVLILSILCSCSNKKSDITSPNQGDAIPNVGNSLAMATDSAGITGNYNTQTENGYYEIYQNGVSGCNILYTDFMSGQRIFLCNRVECTHRDETCTSWIDNTNGGILLMAQEDGLYYWQLGGVTKAGNSEDLMHLWKMDFDGKNRTMICEYDNKQRLSSGVASDGSTLFCIFDVFSENLEKVTKQLVAINKENGVVTCLQEFNGQVFLVGAYDQTLLLKTYYPITHITNSTSNDAQLSSPPLIHITAWDVTDDDYFELAYFSADCSIYCTPSNILYWTNDTMLGRMDMRDIQTKQEIYTFSSPQKTLIEYADTTHLLFYNCETGTYQSINCINSELNNTPLTYSSAGLIAESYYPVTVIAASEDCFLVNYQDSIVEGTYYSEDGIPQTMMIHKVDSALISQNNYWNSIPEYIPIKDNVF